MKSLYLFFLFCVIVACSSTKKVVTATEKPIAKANTETIDTMATQTTEVIKMTDELIVPEDDTNTKITETPRVEVNKPVEIEKDETPKTISFNHSTFNNLLQKHVSEKGNVNYPGFKADYKILKRYFSELKQNLPEDSWPKNQKLAYWINAYNAFTIDLILKNYPVKSIKDIKDPWDQRLWKLGEKWYNLNDIEHQILRKMDEPRIHFAIVCASFSCPKLQNITFEASTMEKQLTKATKEFLSDPERNSISANDLEISKIFQWFSKDFKQDGSLIDFINKYTNVEISKSAKKRFKDYNWDLND